MSKRRKAFKEAFAETKHFLAGAVLVLMLLTVVPVLAQFGGPGGGGGGGTGGARMMPQGGQQQNTQQNTNFPRLEFARPSGQGEGGQSDVGSREGQFPGRGQGVSDRGFSGQGQGVEQGFPGRGAGVEKPEMGEMDEEEGRPQMNNSRLGSQGGQQRFGQQQSNQLQDGEKKQWDGLQQNKDLGGLLEDDLGLLSGDKKMRKQPSTIMPQMPKMFEFDADSMFGNLSTMPANKTPKKDIILPQLDLEEDEDLLPVLESLGKQIAKVVKLTTKKKLLSNGAMIGQTLETICNAAELDCEDALDELVTVLDDSKAKTKDLRKAIKKAFNTVFILYKEERAGEEGDEETE